MRAHTIATLLSFGAAGLAAPGGFPGGGSDFSGGSVGLPSGDGAITLCCSGFLNAGELPACVAYNSAIQNCDLGQVRFVCPVTRGVLQGCNDPAGTAASPNILSAVTNLLPALFNINGLL
ncbi:hypothetical protein CDV55_102034 [Aspergillus turcosus]|uniref:Hydrophobin n=1 Tax=Aspergillus turcosus TaxID=1245748 RepID=A0A229X0S9_9EURO|nr:hypothetical protein CDV55_102034 [Aspergillus turcosus]RLL96120.1 hypothetical protein CFD26_105743 [Aspergillus turcosus]